MSRNGDFATGHSAGTSVGLTSVADAAREITSRIIDSIRENWNDAADAAWLATVEPYRLLGHQFLIAETVGDFERLVVASGSAHRDSGT